uniref:Uncharacterized protein n=1 Tax=viral metagenome TaxID=1070528 RepID=A0A6C0DZT4_9ZZZZ
MLFIRKIWMKKKQNIYKFKIYTNLKDITYFTNVKKIK